MDLLATYGRVWGLAWILQVYMQCGGSLQALQPQWAMMALFALGSLSGYTGPVIIGHIGALVWFVWVNPNTFAEEHWAAELDACVVLAGVATLISSRWTDVGWSIRGLTIPERNAIVVQTSALVRPVMVLFYLGCMFWKLTSAFFDLTGSCASLFFCQLLGAYMPAAWTPDWLVKSLVWSAPYVTVIVEGSIGGLLIVPGWSTRCGIAVALLLHLLIAFTPPPNNVGGFGVILAVRFFFFMPSAVAQVFAEMRIQSFMLTAVAVVVASWFGSRWRPSIHSAGSEPMDWMVPGYTLLFLLNSRALVVDVRMARASSKKGVLACLLAGDQNSTKASDEAPPAYLVQPRRKLWWIVVSQAFFYEYVCISLGLTDNGPPKPYANIRTYGGSNHFFMPTGLLLPIGEDHPSWFGGLYAGGIVRVENTSSQHFNALSPGEITSQLDPRALELCKIAGHHGRIFGPDTARFVGAHAVTPNVPGPGFIRYTMPAFELRRFLAEARAKNESFSLEYTRLPHYDARDDMPASGPRVRLDEDGQGGRTCILVDTSEECRLDELALLPPLGYWHSKVTVFWPNPIIPGEREVYSGYCLPT